MKFQPRRSYEVLIKNVKGTLSDVYNNKYNGSPNGEGQILSERKLA